MDFAQRLRRPALGRPPRVAALTLGRDALIARNIVQQNRRTRK